MVQTLRVTHRSGIDDQAEIVNHSNSPACPGRMFELNPAYGCQFRCAYCGIYALERDYYGEVIIYDDFPEYLDQYLAEHPPGDDDSYFYFSAKTDCLQPALVESGITLACLEILRKHHAPHFIVTKGGIPPQDICDSLIAARDFNQVIVSATMPTEEMREKLEPGAAPVSDRIALARFCSDNGIFVTASCCPILPVTDLTYLRDVFRQLHEAGVNHFYFDFARLSRDAVENMIDLLPEHRANFERHYYTDEARLSRWDILHQGVTIDKIQPPQRFMLEAFEGLAECINEVAPGATVSICNHFTTRKTLHGFNDRARSECISCMGQRFDQLRVRV